MGVDLFLTWTGYAMIFCLLIWWSMVLKQYIISPFSQYIFHKKNNAALLTCNDVLKYVLDVIEDIVKKNFQILVTMDSSARDLIKSQDQILEIVAINKNEILAHIPSSLSNGVIFNYITQDQFNLYVYTTTLRYISSTYKIIPKYAK